MDSVRNCAVHFIKRDIDEKYYLTEEARLKLSSINGDIYIVTVAGKIRTGKSYLFSQIVLQLTGQTCTFEVSHDVFSKTKGIWLALCIVENKNYLLLDTEGLFSIGAKEKEDLKLISLSVILSSYVVFNIMRLPERDDLNLVKSATEFAKIIKKQSEGALPRLLFLIRDFSFSTIIIEEQEVFETIFAEYKGETPLKEDLINSYGSYQFLTIPPPLDNFKNLLKLESLEKSELNQEFNEKVKLVTKTILKSSKPKERIRNGKELIQYIENILECLNESEFRVISIADRVKVFSLNAKLRELKEETLKKIQESFSQTIYCEVSFKTEWEKISSWYEKEIQLLPVSNIVLNDLQSELKLKEYPSSIENLHLLRELEEFLLKSMRDQYCYEIKEKMTIVANSITQPECFEKSDIFCCSYFDQANQEILDNCKKVLEVKNLHRKFKVKIDPSSIEKLFDKFKVDLSSYVLTNKDTYLAHRNRAIQIFIQKELDKSISEMKVLSISDDKMLDGKIKEKSESIFVSCEKFFQCEKDEIDKIRDDHKPNLESSLRSILEIKKKNGGTFYEGVRILSGGVGALAGYLATDTILTASAVSVTSIPGYACIALGMMIGSSIGVLTSALKK